MKIGISTFHSEPNYGAVLQAFALQTFLGENGYDPFFIDYRRNPPSRNLRNYIGHSVTGTAAKLALNRRRKDFHDFRLKYLNVSETIYANKDDLINNPPKADAYICGSDQIWNPNFFRGENDECAYFLKFGSTDIARIAYAPSFGVSSLSQEWTKRVSYNLERFDAVSVREKNALSIASTLGRKDAVWVPDPTLLLQADKYKKLFNLSATNNNYIFSYILDKPSREVILQTKAYVSQFFSSPCFEAYERNNTKVFLRGVLAPCSWLSMLMNSKFVMTNSFHCAVFSILFRRPFIIIPLAGATAGMNGRIESLLEKTGLEDRIVREYDKDNVMKLCKNEINWDTVEEKINDFAKIGALFLSTSLHNSSTKKEG